jgi:hypothetical protein
VLVLPVLVGLPLLVIGDSRGATVGSAWLSGQT